MNRDHLEEAIEYCKVTLIFTDGASKEILTHARDRKSLTKWLLESDNIREVR